MAPPLASEFHAGDSIAPQRHDTEERGPRAGEILDLNRATAAELDALPGIGPVLAARIIAHRQRHGPFRSSEELLAVRGIGPRLFARIGPRVRAGPGAGAAPGDSAPRAGR